MRRIETLSVVRIDVRTLGGNGGDQPVDGLLPLTVAEMRVNAHRGINIRVTEKLLRRKNAYASLKQHRRIAMPLRNNYDKPEKPRISRVLRFGA